MRQIGRQIICGLKRIRGGAVECPSHARAVAFIGREIPDLFAQVLETLSGERRYVHKRIAAAMLSVASNTVVLIGRLAARLCEGYRLLTGRSRLRIGRSRGNRCNET